jgi:hypothetical protein
MEIATTILRVAASPQPVDNAMSLFEALPMFSLVNPPMDVRRSDTGQVILAIKKHDWPPFLVQFPPEEAAWLRAELARGARGAAT